ncbi:UBX domain-containing protein 4-like [Antedon mediterranea]|uniref:UBX domain-containing protein 4-like n=1 Tax=Antedon mediterranea TaxID=105859 RepID=UPI003AF51126
MLWYEESINAAIKAAQQKNSVFLVYIRGNEDDTGTKTMDKSWDDGDVEQICKDGGVVAIRLNANSVECAQFSEHYPVVCIPSVSFIDGSNGVYLEAIAGAVTPQELKANIKKIVEKKNGTKSRDATDSNTQVKTSPQSVSSAAPQAAASVSTTQSESSSSAKKTEETIEEKAARLRKKMYALQEKKEKQKKQVEKQKEMERRETGKQMQEQKKKNQDSVALRAMQERKKEKQEEEMHRKLVREQLERDKLEKKTRFEAEKREREEGKGKWNVQKQEQTAEEELERKRKRMESARIQFRLPDGSTFTNKFQATATFSELYEYIKQKITSEDLRNSFMLSTMYPRRTYGTGDMGCTLTELNLVPDASIIVLPAVVDSPSTNPLMTILWPFLALWNFLMVLIFGKSSSKQPSSSAGDAHSSSQGATSDTHSSGEPGPSTGARPKSSYGRRQNAGASRGMTQVGNIHRLASISDDEDENNTWNGNSTQQL